MPIANATMKEHQFLTEMYDDGYFPNHLVDKCKQVLVSLCERIESENPADNASLFQLTHAAVTSINHLEGEFEENDSELETGAREALAGDFEIILQAYGFADADLEDAISNRDW